MDDVVPLHNSSREERVSKLFSFAWVDYEASVIVPYVTVYGVARSKVLVCTRADKSTTVPGFCCFVNLSAGMAGTRPSTTLVEEKD